MGASNFSDEELSGAKRSFWCAVEKIRDIYGFDFVACGLTSFVGAPLKWVYSAGATGGRHRRIQLAPGHGIGGIIIKTGKPMVFTDIDKEIDPQEYSSYPIVFAEDLRSFCAIPLTKEGHAVAVLLVAFRTVKDGHKAVYQRFIASMEKRWCGLVSVTEDFINFDTFVSATRTETGAYPILCRSDLSRTIAAQEDERKRISRELHDGIAQELLIISFSFKQLSDHVDLAGVEVVGDIQRKIEHILDELHNISNELRPSTLDHLGFVSALHSQASFFEKNFGTDIVFEGTLSQQRFDRALETQVYRICQEAILNACKYSQTDQVFVTLEDLDGWLYVTVIDHGVGFDVEHPLVRGSGCGLMSMRERASAMGATLTISSCPQGTTISLVAPMGNRCEKGGTL